jgi:hypothetical protein
VCSGSVDTGNRQAQAVGLVVEERHPAPVGRDLEVEDAFDLDAPDLGAAVRCHLDEGEAGACGQERDALAVGRPGRTRVSRRGR